MNAPDSLIILGNSPIFSKKGTGDQREVSDFLPFFQKRKQLAAFIGGRFSDLFKQDRIAFEYDLFGDFACDLVIGNSQTATWCFVEFEEGTIDSIFRRAGKKATSEWGAHFNHGYNQIIDWLWKLDEMQSTQEMGDRFGTSRIAVYGLRVIGRESGLSARERRRLDWRAKKVLVNSHQVKCVTFDQLFEDMEYRLREGKSVRSGTK